MSRVSSAQIAQQSIRAIGERQSRISQLQQQISSGQRIARPSDDPVSASQAVQTRSDISRADTERRMVDFARNKLTQAEGAIGAGVDLFQSAREILLAANNDTNGSDERKMFAQQLRSMRDELVNIANRSDGLGAYVFGGAGSQTQPFVSTGSDITYVADAGEQLTGNQYQFATSLNGQELFNSVPAPDGTRGSVFSALQATITLLESPNLSSEDIHTGLKVGIDALDSSLNQFSATRARLGEQMAAADRALDALSDTDLSAHSRLSDLTDTDFAAAISELSAQQTNLDAAMRTYAQISGLSLFDYIR